MYEVKLDGLDVMQVSVSRGKTIGYSMILAAQNPVTLLSAWASRRF
jgi:precorrin-6B methylase 2